MARVKGKSKDKPETLPITLTDTHGNVTAKYTSEMVETIKNTVAQGATDNELMMFLMVANKYNLDPLLGQVYFVKYKDKPTVMAGRDGYRKIAKSKPTFKKCQSMAVYDNDEFEMEMVLGEIKNITHKFNHKERGKVSGAYAVLTTTDGDTLVAWADIREYDTKQNAWTKYKSAMIKKVAETEVYKAFADIDGIQAEEAMPKQFAKERNTSDNVEENHFNEEDVIDTEIVPDDGEFKETIIELNEDTEESLWQ